mgnify:CR=1 FL=1
MATKTLATKTLLAHLRNRLQSRLQEFRTANAANVTVTFALATIPMVGFVGAAVDYSHANAVKAAMQAAAAAFVGMKNFQSFAASDEDDAETTK